MDRQRHVPAGFLFYKVQEGTKLKLAPPRLNVPRGFCFPHNDYALRGGIYVGPVAVDFRRKAIGHGCPIGIANEAIMPAQRRADRLDRP